MISMNGGWKGSGIPNLKKDLKKRIENAGRHVGRHLADHVTHEVTKRLHGSGWIAIYRNAIFYRETPDGTEWAVAGLSQEESLTRFPGKTSLASFSPTGDGRWPAEYNPWPLDMIPGATYRGSTIIVRSASESQVESYRAARARNLPTLLAALAEQGVVVTENALPVADNGVFADIVYLARRLELGYEGFARMPHWGPAASIAEASAARWMNETSLVRLIDGAVKGVTPGEVQQMSKADAEALDKLREATWS